jgi:hypothetical protein
MDPQILFSLPIACAGAFAFFAYKRRAKHRHNLEMMRSRILFGISVSDVDEREKTAAIFARRSRLGLR